MSASLSLEESRELIKVCQSGRLYAIRDWISAGKSLRTAPETKKTILSVAIKTGFHSLVELIAPHETLEAKNQGLANAVLQKRLDLVELLVACGAEIKAIPFSDVLLGWEPRSRLKLEIESNGPPVYYAYILRCADDSFYVGSAQDLDSRVKAHNDGRGAAHTFKPVQLVYSEGFRIRNCRCYTRAAA
jgi:hypothetical protein